jgi:tRNA (guanine37-N1)-methyltransferase
MIFDVLTTFPESFGGPLSESIIGRARESGLISLRVFNIRDFTTDRHRSTDDAPFGGGAGMMMKPAPLVSAIAFVRAVPPGPVGPVILMSPQGRRLDQGVAEELSGHPRLVLVCGHYEGVDERVVELCIDEELSIGDYVVTGGEVAAAVVIDVVARMVPGVVGHPDSPLLDSFAGDGLLDYPHYTRPREFRGLSVPDVLLSGHHAEIDKWRRRQSVERTFVRRPDLLERARLTKDDRELIRRLGEPGAG